MSERVVATGFHGDESGFCWQPTLGRCWQPPGPTLAVPAPAHGRRWNVCGFLRGDGELAHAGRVVSNTLYGTLDALRARLDAELATWNQGPERLGSLTSYPYLIEALAMMA